VSKYFIHLCGFLFQELDCRICSDCLKRVIGWHRWRIPRLGFGAADWETLSSQICGFGLENNSIMFHSPIQLLRKAQALI